jgi:IQ and AAA domain-containing protein
LKDEFKNSVDEMIKVELDNMRLMGGSKSKKKKGKKKKSKKKKKKKKTIKLPGFKMIRDMSKEEILIQLINSNIVKKIPTAKLTDFVGEFNYISSMMDIPTESAIDPSMALIRQLVTEYIIFPLGSELCRSRYKTTITSFLFYGPAGTGKTLVVRAVVAETNSILFDLSPINIDGKYIAKKEEEKLIASVMVTAKEYQPSVILIDECEKVWPAKKKGAKKKGAKKKKNDPANASRIKKALTKWKAKHIDSDVSIRISIIGCSSDPGEATMKDLKKFFAAGN